MSVERREIPAEERENYPEYVPDRPPYCTGNCTLPGGHAGVHVEHQYVAEDGKRFIVPKRYWVREL